MGWSEGSLRCGRDSIAAEPVKCGGREPIRNKHLPWDCWEDWWTDLRMLRWSIAIYTQTHTQINIQEPWIHRNSAGLQYTHYEYMVHKHTHTQNPAKTHNTIPLTPTAAAGTGVPTHITAAKLISTSVFFQHSSFFDFRLHVHAINFCFLTIFCFAKHLHTETHTP